MQENSSYDMFLWKQIYIFNIQWHQILDQGQLEKLSCMYCEGNYHVLFNFHNVHYLTKHANTKHIFVSLINRWANGGMDGGIEGWQHNQILYGKNYKTRVRNYLSHSTQLFFLCLR